ncbi:MAG: hypothetical protein IKC56_00985 [Clostridia bacterium]|nr:hypothetical protein [Clostridia bacterium]
MKKTKFVTKLLSVLALSVIAISSFVLAGCGKTPKDVAIYMPDGAPALAFAKLMHEDSQLGEKVTYTVVNASDIGAKVATGEASVALMPVNAAAKLCGKGDKYIILSVNTHGNLYLLGKEVITDVQALKGKKIGVVNLANVPGLTFKAILQKNQIAYTSDESALTDNNVYLKGVEATQIAALLNATGNAKLDYVVAPEPQVSKLTTAAPVIKNVMSLQALWGADSYPQAVLVVKKELAENTAFCNQLLNALTESATWVKTNGQAAYTAIASHTAEGYSTTLNPAVLTENAITGCNIKVVKASEMKSVIVDYLAKIMAVEPTSAATVSDDFFL